MAEWLPVEYFNGRVGALRTHARVENVARRFHELGALDPEHAAPLPVIMQSDLITMDRTNMSSWFSKYPGFVRAYAYRQVAYYLHPAVLTEARKQGQKYYPLYTNAAMAELPTEVVRVESRHSVYTEDMPDSAELDFLPENQMAPTPEPTEWDKNVSVYLDNITEHGYETVKSQALQILTSTSVMDYDLNRMRELGALNYALYTVGENNGS